MSVPPCPTLGGTKVRLQSKRHAVILLSHSRFGAFSTEINVMWVPTQDEAVEMYACFLAARHGSAAGQYARETADKLQTKGDFAGYAIWSRVADVVERKSLERNNVESVMAL